MSAVETVGGTRVLVLDADGETIAGEAGALDVIGSTYGLEIDMVAVPVGRLGPDFFDLKTREAGGFIQKLVNYSLKVAFVGDLERRIAGSGALADFVRESNRGDWVAFVPDLPALRTRLAHG